MAKQHKSKTGRGARRKGRGKATQGDVNLLTGSNQLERPNVSRKAPAEGEEKKPSARVATKGPNAADEPNHSSSAKANGRSAQRKRRRKQVRLSVAMRKIGLDEYMVAKGLAGLIESLGKNRGEAKVLLEALKESTRVLEPPPKAYGTDEGGAAGSVVLRHDVPRPARNAAPEQNTLDSAPQ